jgi:hypothetical protein
VWATFTRRTDDPKLTWIEKQLDAIHVPHRRNGESVHGPILQVPSVLFDKAWTVLTDEIDDLPDDDPMFSGI